MNRVGIWLLHKRLEILGDPEFDRAGGGIIPCKKCYRKFRSWCHYSSDYGIIYDSFCPDCRFEADAKEYRRIITEALNLFDSKWTDWQSVKGTLRACLINIEGVKKCR